MKKVFVLSVLCVFLVFAGCAKNRGQDCPESCEGAKRALIAVSELRDLAKTQTKASESIVGLIRQIADITKEITGRINILEREVEEK